MEQKKVRGRYQVSQDVDRVARLKKLYELSMTLSGDPVDVFRHVARMIGELLNVRVVCLSEIKGKDLHFRSVYIDGEVILDAGQCPLDITPCATVESSKDIRVYEGVSELFPKASFLKDHNAHAYCGFPSIDNRGEVVAVTCLLDDKEHEFSIEDLDLLRIFGQRIGMEIEREKLLAETAKTEETLRHAQKMEAVGQLTGGVAHDFNNLLSVILGNAELVSDIHDRDSEAAQRLEAVMRAARRGADLTQQLLAYSRKQALRPQTIRLDSQITEMTGMLHRTLGENIEIRTRIAPDLWPCKADPAQVETALLNLCINARDAMLRSGGRLTIRIENAVLDNTFAATQSEVVAGDYVVLEVSDDGVGMSPEIMDRVFEPFFTTKDVGEGTGLGLSMVFGFAKQSGGHVTVESEAGRGTTFRLYLPRTADSAEQAEPETADSEAEPRGRGETVLVVEDDPQVRVLAAGQLRKLGYQVLESADGADALRTLESGPAIDLLLNDVVLRADLSGPELAAKIEERLPGNCVLYMSGFADDDALPRQAGKTGILLGKPFSRRDLAHKVRATLDRLTA